MSAKYVGARFGSLLVLDGWSKNTSGGNYKSYVRVRCDCGVEYDVALDQVRRAKDAKCKACRKNDFSTTSLSGYKHPLYGTWQGMVQRCTIPSIKAYKYYGARGVSVCAAWLGATSTSTSTMAGFRQFLADMGDRPPGFTLDRIDVNGNYEPTNCRWAPWDVQANNRTNNVAVTLDGESKTVTQWSELVGTDGWYLAAQRYALDPSDVLRVALQHADYKRWDWQKLLGVPSKRKGSAPQRKVLTEDELARLEEFKKFLDDTFTLS